MKINIIKIANIFFYGAIACNLILLIISNTTNDINNLKAISTLSLILCMLLTGFIMDDINSKQK